MFLYSLLIGVCLKSAAVLTVAAVVALLLKRRSAAARHIVWTAAFAALLALPFLSLSLPAVSVPVSGTLLTTAAAFQITSTAHAPSSQTAPSNPPVSNSTAPRLNWRLALALLWIAGLVVSSARMLIAWYAMLRLRRTASVIDEAGVNGVEVREAESGTMPMVAGFLKPVILMPADARTWTAERRRVVLLHELAHVERGDVSTHILARAALSLYWWNPLAWFAWLQFLKEREQAADDLVLSSGARPSDYAGHLLEIARTMQTPSAVGWAAIAMARTSQLESRMVAILDPQVTRSQRRMSALAVTAMAVAMVAPIAALRAQEALPGDLDAAIRSAKSQANAGMLETMASAAESTRKYDAAQKLLEAALSISAQGSEVYGRTLIQLGDLERMRGRFADAQPFYTQAAAALGDKPAAAPALTNLGIAALVAKNPAQAQAYFERARNADPAQAAMPVMWLAVIRERDGNMPEADALYRNAIGIGGTAYADAATAMEVYAQFLQRQNRQDEADMMKKRAAELRNTFAVKPTLPEGVYRIGDKIAPPKVLSKVEPEYSEEARAAKYQGTVVLNVEIGVDGLAHNLQIQRGLGLGLNELAMDAITQWQFKPGMKDGQPVTVVATIEVNFRLL